jgi:hypothetical protein
MPKSVLDKDAQQFIRENRLLLSSGGMAERLKVSKSVVQRYLNANGLKPAAEVIERFRVEGMTGRTNFSEQEDTYIKDNYLLFPIKALAEKMGRSYTGIMKRLDHFGLTIPENIKNRNIAAGRIKKGNVPLNKGKAMSKELYEKCKATMFKKGNVPGNAKKRNGIISIRMDKTGVQYKYIRISLGKWDLLHRVIWIKKYGAIPKGMCIVFKDSNSMNCRLNNLEIITRKELRLRNSGSVNLSDRYVANALSRKDKALADKILVDHPELIDLKRQSLLLNRTINEQRDNNSNS